MTAPASSLARPMPRSIRAVVLTLLAFLAAPGLGAQDVAPPVSESLRSGFHFSVGLGSASMGATCDRCDASFFSERINGLSGVLQVGGAVSSKLVLAGEFVGWVRNDEPIWRRVAGLSIAFLGYPSETSGFFLKGSVGAMRAIVENEALVVQTDAWTATTGIGFDIPVSDKVNITPYLNYIRSFGGETTANGFVSPVPAHPNAFQLGAALTVH